MSALLAACGRACGLAASVLRQVVGAPDYDRYVTHVRRHHPGTEPIGMHEFYRARLEERYNTPGSKCC